MTIVIYLFIIQKKNQIKKNKQKEKKIKIKYQSLSIL